MTLHVSHPADVAAARQAARKLAEAVGLEPSAGEEIALAVSELATNLVRHAEGGRLVLTPFTADGRAGLQLESLDAGPGIPDIGRALTDGFSTAGGLGNGLGTVNRIMDELDIQSTVGCGTHIICRKQAKAHAAVHGPCPLDIGVATRPKPGFRENGDSFVIVRGEGSALVGVIDGVGHGEEAQAAALAVRRYVEFHSERPLEALFHGADLACRGTRGCVMALARFEWQREAMLFASVGNIEARAFGVHPSPSLILRRGIVGVNCPKAVVSEHHWTHGVLVFHSDGLSTHWTWSDFPELSDQPANIVAQQLLRRLANPQDDATVLIVRKN